MDNTAQKNGAQVASWPPEDDMEHMGFDFVVGVDAVILFLPFMHLFKFR